VSPLPDTPPPYGTVVFDCDSTLSEIEGIEELAREHRDEVARLTARAMDGELPLEEAYGARLDLIRPNREAVLAVADLYLRRAVPGARALVGALRALEKRVVVVSGGLLPAVLPFARALGVEGEDSVHAVDVRFDGSGAYLDFDRDSPLARSGGKVPVLRSIVAREGAGRVAFIGDGATDLEAAGEVDRFVAFGGVAPRAAVLEAARVRVLEADLAALAPHLLTGEELAALDRHPEHRPLVAAARDRAGL
jgi:phosphoserine phosphatase